MLLGAIEICMYIVHVHTYNAMAHNTIHLLTLEQKIHMNT